VKKVFAPRVVNCPICGKPVPWTPESAFRPFCSERCRSIDLGAWAAEEYRVPANEHRPTDDEQ
jgi:endogenous inhibitor of DNA gyrase (YacG/DUF329 family)